MHNVILQSWAHLHILVSVFPSVGLIFALGFYVTGFFTNNEALKRSCLVAFGIMGLSAIPTYFSGDGAAEVLSQNPKFTEDMVSTHLGWGVAALAGLAATGLGSWIALWRVSRAARACRH